MTRTASAPHTHGTRRAARHPRVQHLVTADESSLLELETFLATLPMCATGRVFIEVADADAIGVVDAPSRMTVTWLPRASRSGAPGTGRACARGEALTRATCAWADEMLYDDESDTAVTLLGGFLGTADIVEHLTQKVGVDTDRIYTPERFGLFLPR